MKPTSRKNAGALPPDGTPPVSHDQFNNQGPDPMDQQPGCSYRSSSGVEGFEVGDQGVVDLAGEVALDAADDLGLG
jgi:hypothetical protein